MSVHDGHKRCELERQGEVCKMKLKQTRKDTDRLIEAVKQAMAKTKQHAQEAEKDIDMCEKISDTKDKKMLQDLANIRRHLKKNIDVIIDSQRITLARLESFKFCRAKLTEKDRVYDYVTATESIQRDVDEEVTDLPGFRWSCAITKKSSPGEMIQGQVDIKQSELVNKKQQEVGKIHLRDQSEAVMGMAVYKKRVNVVHNKGLVIYCYNPDGYEKYKHKSGAKTNVHGMCMMIHEGTARLVVSDSTNDALVWITISDGGAMQHHHTQQVRYKPCASYNDRGHLMVCSPEDHNIHRYTGDGQPLNVIKLTGDVKPCRVTRDGDGDQYVVTDWQNQLVAVIDGKGRVVRRYNDNIHGVKLGEPWDITTDKQGRILVVDNKQHNVLQISRDGEEVKQLLQGQVKHPSRVCLDEENNKMYVSAEIIKDMWAVFFYDYNILTDGNTFTETITKLDMVAVL